jgi:hypothetical protein
MLKMLMVLAFGDGRLEGRRRKEIALDPGRREGRND